MPTFTIFAVCETTLSRTWQSPRHRRVTPALSHIGTDVRPHSRKADHGASAQLYIRENVYFLVLLVHDLHNISAPMPLLYFPPKAAATQRDTGQCWSPRSIVRRPLWETWTGAARQLGNPLSRCQCQISYRDISTYHY